MLLRPPSIAPVEYPLISEAVLDKNFPAVNPPSINGELRSQAWLHTQTGTSFAWTGEILLVLKSSPSISYHCPTTCGTRDTRQKVHQRIKLVQRHLFCQLNPCNLCLAQSSLFSYFCRLHFVTLSPTPLILALPLPTNTSSLEFQAVQN